MVEVKATREGVTITQRCSDRDMAERVAREFVHLGFVDIEIDGVPFEAPGPERERDAP
jgi:hypothetical protein